MTPSPVGCLQGVGRHRFRLALPLLVEPSLTDILLSPRVNTCLRMSLAPMGFGTGADPTGCCHFPLSPTVTARRCLAGCLAPGLRASAVERLLVGGDHVFSFCLPELWTSSPQDQGRGLGSSGLPGPRMRGDEVRLCLATEMSVFCLLSVGGARLVNRAEFGACPLQEAREVAARLLCVPTCKVRLRG